MRKYAAKIGLERGYSAHLMRATFITTALENGAQLEDVQKAAGHRDPSTTKLYDRRHYNPEKAASFFATYDAALTPTVADESPRVGYLDPTNYQQVLERLSSWVAFTPMLDSTSLAQVLGARRLRVREGPLRLAASATWHLRLQPADVGCRCPI